MNEEKIAKRFRIIRHYFEGICAPIQAKDSVVQYITEMSSPKWYLAHITWFFETFVLQAFLRDYRLFHPRFGYLFNSYYNHAARERKGEMALCK